MNRNSCYIIILFVFLSTTFTSHAQRSIFTGTWEYQKGDEIFRVMLSEERQDDGQLVIKGHYEKVIVTHLGNEAFVFCSEKERFIGNNEIWLPFAIYSGYNDNEHLFSHFTDNTVNPSKYAQRKTGRLNMRVLSTNGGVHLGITASWKITKPQGPILMESPNYSVPTDIVLTKVSSKIYHKDPIKRSYEISIFGFPQKLVLKEFEDGKYEGGLITKITRTIDGKSAQIIDRREIPQHHVIGLMRELQEAGIEKWKFCDDNAACGYISFLRSRLFYVKIENRNFDTLESQKIDEIDLDEVSSYQIFRKIHSFEKIIKKRIDLFREFYAAFRRLPKGTYDWDWVEEETIGILKTKK